MNVFKRQILKGSISNMAGIGLGVVNNLWLLPLVFSLEELGRYRWVERTAMLFAAIGMMGLHNLYVRFQSRFKDEDARQFGSNILSLLLSIALLLGLALTLFSFSLARLFSLEDYGNEIMTLGAVVSGTMAYTLGLSFSSTSKRIAIPFFAKNVGIRVGLMFAALAVWMGQLNFNRWMLIFAFLNLAVGLGVLYYGWRLRGFQWVLPRALGQGLSKEMRVFASSSILMAVIGMSLTTIDSQMIAGMLGLENLGIYSVAFFLGSFIDGIRRPISQSLSPQFATHWNNENIEALESLYSKTSRILMVVAVLAFVFIVPNLDFLFSFIPNSDRFDPAKPVITYILLSRVIDFSFGSNGEILANSPYFKWNMGIMALLVALLIGLNYFLLPVFGIIGVGYSLVISYALINTSKAIYLYRKVGIQPFGKVQFQIMIAAFIALAGGLWWSAGSIVEVLLRNLWMGGIVVAVFFRLRKQF